MPAGRPLVGCVRSTAGLGFIQSWVLGLYISSPTYLVSPIDFAQTPSLLLQTLSRYRVRDTYATGHMLQHIANHTPVSGSAGSGHALGSAGLSSSLGELRNLMILSDDRAPSFVLPAVSSALSAHGLDPSALSPVYGHPLNPVITSRSYMGIQPVELFLDRAALRRGFVVLIDSTDPKAASALRVHDSGIVSASTQVCILNPESGRIARLGEFGEIWVAGPANIDGFYRSRDPLDAGRVGATLAPDDCDALADPSYSHFIRTGDLGFLHTVHRPVGPGGSIAAMQLLFVLGNIGETFDVYGLHHFPADIEASIESSHGNIVPGGSAVFQAGGLVVVLVEVSRRSYLAGIVPVIVNTVLNEHQFVVDIVAFVGPGDFPRSRLGEKQRGKILGGWVARKWLKVIAQFAIADTNMDSEQTHTDLGNTMTPDDDVLLNSVTSSDGSIPRLPVKVFVTDEHGHSNTADADNRRDTSQLPNSVDSEAQSYRDPPYDHSS